MSGIGFWEVMLVFLIGLIVLGPERLPRVAHQLGTWLGQARRMTRMMKRQLEDELNLENSPSIRRPAATPLPRSSQTPDRQAPDRVDERPDHRMDDGGRDDGAGKDDKYSPAHDAGAPGTGVGSDSRHSEETDRAPDAPAEERNTATEPAEPPAQEKAS